MLAVPVLIWAVGASAAALTFSPSNITPSGATTGLDSSPVSISYEFFTWPNYYSNIPSTVQCMANFAALTGSKTAIRIGGTTQDRGTFQPNGTAAITYPSATATAVPGALTYGPQFFQLAASYGGQVTIGLNRRLNDLNNTIAAAQSALSLMPNLDSLELGNEPDFYVHTDPIGMGIGWSPARDAASQILWDTQVGQSLGVNRIIKGGVYFQHNTYSVAELAPQLEASTAGPYMKVYAGHAYPQSACGGASTNLQNLMTHSSIVSYCAPYANEVHAARNLGKDYHVGETNSATCGGGGISPQFGSALWIVDYTLQMMVLGVKRLYFHQGTIGNCPYCWWGQYQIGDPYYGAYFATQALAQTDSITMLDTGKTDYATYALYNGGVLVKMVLYNSDYYTGGTRSVQSWTLSNLPGATVRALRLTGPSATAVGSSTSSRPNISGLGFADVTCNPTGQQTYEVTPVNCGTATFQVAASEVLLLFLDNVGVPTCSSSTTSTSAITSTVTTSAGLTSTTTTTTASTTLATTTTTAASTTTTTTTTAPTTTTASTTTTTTTTVPTTTTASTTTTTTTTAPTTTTSTTAASTTTSSTTFSTITTTSAGSSSSSGSSTTASAATTTTTTPTTSTSSSATTSIASVPTIPSTSNGYAYVDSFVDSTTSRVLPYQQTLDSNTISNCVAACASKGYPYAGLEFSDECYCGLVAPSTAGGQTPTMLCSGDMTAYCGGPNVIQVYRGTPPSSASPPTIPPTSNGYAYVDSFVDSINSRVLPYQQTLDSNTISNCVAACASEGYPYAGLEFSTECYCGTVAPSTAGGQTPTMLCSGDMTTYCGGPNVIQVYHGTPPSSASPPSIPPTSNGYGYVDSFVDSVDSRVLPYRQSLASNTISNCVAACSSEGYPYAGLEYSSECYCGTAAPSSAGAQTPTMLCSGDMTTYCGGPNVIQVYHGQPSVSPPTIPQASNGYQYLDSFEDSISARVLPYRQTLDTTTVDKCVAACSSQGYQYAGLEYASECYCGAAAPSIGGQVPTMLCSGDTDTYCGGPNVIQVYKRGSS